MGLLDEYKKKKMIEEMIDVLEEKITSMDKSLKEISEKMDRIIKILERR